MFGVVAGCCSACVAVRSNRRFRRWQYTEHHNGEQTLKVDIQSGALCCYCCCYHDYAATATAAAAAAAAAAATATVHTGVLPFELELRVSL
eukprot:5863-Heterococcus_DN1.PRE.3